MNTQWWERDKEILENIPTWALLKTVHGFPVWHNLNTAGFWIITREVKRKLIHILHQKNGDNLCDLLEREFDETYIQRIIHALYLGLYHETLHPVSLTETITNEVQSKDGNGRLLERIFAHSIDKLVPRFSAFKTPRRIDHGGEMWPGLDMIFWDRESGIVWWMKMTTCRKGTTWLIGAQREVDKWVFSDMWYRNTPGIHAKHPLSYKPNRIMSLRFHHMKITREDWIQNFNTWQEKGYADNLFDDFSPEIWAFLRELFLHFGLIMDHINAIIAKNMSSKKNGIFAVHLVWKMQIECTKEVDGIVIKYWNRDFTSPLSLTLIIPYKNLWIPIEKTGDNFIDNIRASMYHAGWMGHESLVSTSESNTLHVWKSQKS